MRLGEILRLVWLNLTQNKSRVILTSIGIIAGSATIMLVLAIGKGGQMEVAEQFKNLNAGAIDITCEGDTGEEGAGSSRGGNGGSPPGNPGGVGGGVPGGGGNVGPLGGGMAERGMGGGLPGFGADFTWGTETVSLDAQDLEEILAYVPTLSDGTLSFSAKADVEGGSMDESVSFTVAGVKANYAQISNLDLAIGEFLTEENDEKKEKICVLGKEAAREIFGSSYDAFNSTVYIDSRPYVVAGVIREMGTVASGISPDETIFIPYATGIKYITGKDVSPTVTVIAREVEQVDEIMDDVEAVLLDSYPDTKFTLSDAGTKMEAASRSNETLQLLLIAMATIVFIIGGIGIMNVLFVSVKERTGEIGVLKAIGCSRKDILTEFLMEASGISLVGAVLGVLLGLCITPVIEQFSVRVELSLTGMVLSLLFGVLTGSLFGFYPAFRASRLIPVMALNHT